MLSDRCLSVCNVGVLWLNGWMDQDETWHGVGLCPGHVLDGAQLPLSKGHSPQFSAHIYCDQTAVWIKMPLGMEVGLDPGDVCLILVGDPPPPKKRRGQSTQPKFWPMSIVAKRLDG